MSRSESTNKGRVIRHRHFDQLRTNSCCEDMVLRGAIKGQVHGHALPRREVPASASKAQAPPKSSVHGYHKVDAALIGNTGYAVRKGPSPVVRIRTARPVADL